MDDDGGGFDMVPSLLLDEDEREDCSGSSRHALGVRSEGGEGEEGEVEGGNGGWGVQGAQDEVKSQSPAQRSTTLRVDASPTTFLAKGMITRNPQLSSARRVVCSL